MTTETATNTAELGTAQDSKIVANMREGFKMGYWIAMGHFEELLEKRIEIKSNIINKTRNENLPQMEKKVKSMRDETNAIMDLVFMHRCRLEENFDFTKGGINYPHN